MSSPRLITATEVLAERENQIQNGYWPHDWNTRQGLWVSCDCPKCRQYYDPTGEETAKYLNMEFPSWFDGQGEKPSFGFSNLAKESYLAYSQPGFYIGNAKKAASLEDVILMITPPFTLKPKRILHIAENHDWTEFLLSEGHWILRRYVKGRIVYDTKTEDLIIPFLDLAKRLQDIFTA